MEFYIYLALIVLLLSLVKGANNKVVYIGVAFALFFWPPTAVWAWERIPKRITRYIINTPTTTPT